jgi:hypothetical protein
LGNNSRQGWGRFFGKFYGGLWFSGSVKVSDPSSGGVATDWKNKGRNRAGICRAHPTQMAP